MSGPRDPNTEPCSISPRTVAALLNIEFLTVRQASVEHFYSPRTIRQWCDEGRFEAYKWAGAWLIVRSEFAEFCRLRRD